jgi:hypothetical protein
MPLTESSEVVSEVGDAGGLDAGEDHLSLWDCRGSVNATTKNSRAISMTDVDTPVHF